MTDSIRRDVKRLQRQYAELQGEIKAVSEINQILLDLILEDRPHLKPVIEALKGQTNERQ